MKLLGWMHRKFRQNSGELLKDLAIGQASHDDQHYYPKPNCAFKQFRQDQKDNVRKSFAGLEAPRAEEGDVYDDESSAEISDLFHGFLSIGTLGSEAINTEPSTPTFPISVENITEKETEITENELKLINDELEKVLVAEARDEYCNDSSGRNSYVSAGRSSHCSTITLSGKPLEGQDGIAVCPLKGYLFGSAVEMADTTTAAKKEHRTSLGELFQKTKMTEENYGREEKKEADKSAVNLMKKALKKRLLHASSKNSSAAVCGPADSASAETKLHKILHMFHRKVHPESSTSKLVKPMKRETWNNTYNAGNYGVQNQLLGEEDITIIPRKSISIHGIRRYKSQSNASHLTICGSESNGNRECWIKTDADYLVLEL